MSRIGAVPTPGAGTVGDALSLDEIERRVTERFPGARGQVENGELTLFVAPEELVAVLTFCRDDDQLACALLSDLSGVHWPGGERAVERQSSTTGWPPHRVSRDEGVIEVAYVLRSVTRNHWLRITVATDDEDPRLPTATGVYETAAFHEREVYDFFGVVFEGHDDLTRILMPDDWVGHPHRKDYPLGGVDIPYEHGAFVPPPEERDLREVVE